MSIITANEAVCLPEIVHPLHSLKSLSNVTIRDLLFMKNDHLALVRTNSIVVADSKRNIIVNTIEMQEEILKAVYSEKENMFFCISTSNRSILSVSNEGQPKFTTLYKFAENNYGHNDFEWEPWLKYFELSQKIILIRKFYCESRVIIFQKVAEDLQIYSEFKCNEECLGKLDEQRYLVNFRQQIKKYMMAVEIFNAQTKQKSRYNLNDEVVPNITKSIKLFKRQEVVSQTSVKMVWLSLLIAMNLKFQGSEVVLIKVLEDSNHYEHQSRTVLPHSEIYQVLTPKTKLNEVMILQYRYEPKGREVSLVLAKYKLDAIKETFTQTDHIKVEQQFQGIRFCVSSQTIIQFENIYQKQEGQTKIIWKNKMKLNLYKSLCKKAVYVSLVKNFVLNNNQKIDNSMIQEIIELLE